ncbi:MAG TPA: hypothetical protein PK536_01060 [Ignavibacteria bacterium]|nr:hypothetical protein [Bacteroidota bacterium]HRI84014.1 hypothetical protein [Ignavibacteria bacterium]HRJ98409.1 hypothetical protein [Ignavibacteria bacterium]
MSIHRIIPSDSTEWDKTLEGINHSFAHTRQSCLAMKLTTGYNTYLYVFEKDNVIIVCPLAERKFNSYTDIVTPYGFSGFTGNGLHPDFLKYWDEFTKENNFVCGYLSQNPLFTKKDYYHSEDSYSNTNLYFLDLRQSLTELFDNLDANRKRIIKNFRQAEASFTYNKTSLTEFFISNNHNFLKSINASEANYFKRETLEYICGLENVYMAGAVEKDKIVSVYIFAHTEYSADCLFNVPLPEGRKYAPTLLWAGLKYYKSKKIPVMNLGGGLKEDDSIAMSKERFGAYKLPFINLKQIYNKNVYEKLCAEVNADKDDMNGYFPAYRRK